jgi:lysophospholipase L1-like esterase
LLHTAFPSQTIAIANRGLPGETALDGSSRLPSVLSAEQPDALLLIEGINDLLNLGFTNNAMQQVRSALQTDIHTAHAAGVTFVFVGTLLPNGTCQALPCRGAVANNPAIDTTNGLIAAMVASESGSGALVVDTNAAYKASNSPSFLQLIDIDGLHPTPAGNAVTAQTFFSTIVTKVPVVSGRLLVVRR